MGMIAERLSADFDYIGLCCSIIVFVFLLLGLFAVFGTVLTLLGAKAYNEAAARTGIHNSARISSAYIRTMLRADDERQKRLEERCAADEARRKAEIDALASRIREMAEELRRERSKQAQAKGRADEIKARRKAISATLLDFCRKLEAQVENSLPWERKERLDRVKSLERDLETGNAGEEEAFSRLKSLFAVQ